MSLANAITGTVAARLFHAVLGLAGSVLVARALGPEQRGVVNYLTLVASLPLLLVGLGLDQSWIYLIGKDPAQRSAIVATSRLAAIGVGLTAVGVSFAWILFDPELPPAVDVVTCALLLVVPLVTALGGRCRALLHGFQSFGAANVGDVSGQIVYVATVGVLVALDVLDVRMAIVAMLVMHTSTFAAMFLSLGRTLAKDVRVTASRFDAALLRRAVSYGRWVFLANVVAMLIYRLDQVMIMWLHPHGELELGLYGLAVLIVERIWLLSMAVSVVNFPDAAGRASGEKGHTPRLARLSLAGSFLAAVALLAIAPVAVPLLFSQQFAACVPMISVLLPGIVFVSALRVLSSDLAARGLVRFNLLNACIGLSVNVVGNWLWIPAWGGFGAAMASNLSYLATFLVALACSTRLLRVGVRELLVPTREDWQLLRDRLRRRPIR